MEQERDSDMIKVAERGSRMIDCFAKETYEVPSELLILESEEHVLELSAHAKVLKVTTSDLGCFRILSQTDGDKRVVWCRRILAEIRAAKEMFLDLISKGMVPYKVGVGGKASSVVMKEFDPTAEEVIFMPVRAIAGG